MHPYSININDRTKVFWIIVPLSLISGYYTNECLLENLPIYQQFFWIIDAPSSGIAYLAIFYKLFDAFVWKWFAGNKLWFKTPVLAGTYKGELLSSRDGKATPTDITIKIEQTLTTIRISLSTRLSTSKSEMAAIVTDEPDGPLLVYEFINDHRKVSDAGLTIHRGLTRLTYNEDDKSLTGTYYTSPERGNYGEIRVYKKVV